MKIISKSLAETESAVKTILNSLKKSDTKATVLLLKGDLGAGKTTFTQFLAKELGVKENLTSPTFVLMKKYVTLHPNFKNLIHIDAYRLNSGADLLNLGWPELLTNPDNLIVIEWPERIADLFDGSEQIINFQFIDENTREISY